MLSGWLVRKLSLIRVFVFGDDYGLNNRYNLAIVVP